jgi:hypothetical protein
MSVRAVWRRFAGKVCGEEAQEEKGFVCGKAGGGVAPCFGRPSPIAARRAVGGGQGGGPEAGRALPLSVIFVTLDPIPNDLVVGVEVAMGGAIAHPGHPLPFDLGVISALPVGGRPYLRRRFVRDLQIQNECGLKCPVRNETRGRSLPLASGPQKHRVSAGLDARQTVKIRALVGASERDVTDVALFPPAGPPNRKNSCTRLRLRKGCNPEPRFSGLRSLSTTLRHGE